MKIIFGLLFIAVLTGLQLYAAEHIALPRGLHGPVVFRN